MPISVPKRLVLAGSGAAVLALGVAVPAFAFGQDPSPSPSGTASASDSLEPDGDQRHAERRDRMAEALAEELGIPKEQVAAALDEVAGQLRDEARAERLSALKERLAEAVSDGRLTQQQADAVLAAAEAGVLLRGPGGPGAPGGHGPGR